MPTLQSLPTLFRLQQNTMSTDSLHQIRRSLQAFFNEDEANEILNKYDTNGDGVLDKDELTVMLAHLAGRLKKKPELVTAVETQKAPARALNGKALSLKLSREQMKEIFREHDVDGDGFLSIGELTKAFSFLGSVVPFYKAYYGLAHADADGDGLVSEAELDLLVDYALKLNKNK